jgi:hypothetical protein
MADIDLKAVCERHGIGTHKYTSGWGAGGLGVGVTRLMPTEVDAVCALLKSRYQITSQPRSTMWVAEAPFVNDGDRIWYTTELAAVVALADRLL